MCLCVVFRNLDDPEDKSFEPEAFPMMELEFPNTQASERSVLSSLFDVIKNNKNRYLLLAPRDPDHYHPVYCLEASLYIIVECASRGLSRP